MPTRSVPVGEIRPLGDHALLLGVADAAAARRLTRSLHRGPARGGGRGGGRVGHGHGGLRSDDRRRRCAAAAAGAPPGGGVRAAGRRRGRWHDAPRDSLHLRWAGPGGGGDAGGEHARGGGGDADGAAPHGGRRSGSLLALRISLAYPPCWARCRAALVPAPPCRPARSPWPTATPPCIRQRRPGDGSSSATRTSHSSRRGRRPTPAWPPATTCASWSPPRRPATTPDGRRHGATLRSASPRRHPQGHEPFSKSTRRACGPCCKTGGGEGWPRSGSRQPARPTPTRFSWPTNWWATRSAPAPSRSRLGARRFEA